MAGQQFQYDDSGNTFFYFLTSFVGLIVIPATYYLWPRDQNAGESRRRPAPPRSPGRPAAPSRPQALPRVPVTPARRGAARPESPPAAGARARSAAISGADRLRGPREFGSDPLRIVLEVPGPPPLCLARLCRVGCSLWSERDGPGRIGMGMGGGRRVGRGGAGAGATPRPPLPSPSSPVSRPGVSAAAVVADVWGAPLSWVACLGLPSELTSRPP